MSLEHVLLGMLKEPATGYDLKKEFDQGARYFWHARLSQIYPTLKRMVKKGWLSCRSQASQAGRERVVYRRTRAGTRALHDWLSEPPLIGQERFAYIAQLVFMGELNELSTTTRFVEQLRAELTRIHDLLQGASREHTQLWKESPHDAELLHAHLSVRLGVRTLAARIAWCDETLQTLRSLSNDKGGEA